MKIGFVQNNNLIGGVFLSYMIALGEFGGFDDGFGNVAPTYVKILFIINTLVIFVVTMNLFIAIISDSFQRISDQGKQASYREKAGMIAEN
jgi:ABC-type molybdate transport system permease subunit